MHTKIVPVLRDADSPQVLYLGDYDLCGDQIESNTRRVLEQETGELSWERIALTAGQVDQWKLPIIVKHDRRYNDGRPHRAVETEALNQKLIIELLERELIAQLPEPLERVLEREERQRRALERIILRLNAKRHE